MGNQVQQKIGPKAGKLAAALLAFSAFSWASALPAQAQALSIKERECLKDVLPVQLGPPEAIAPLCQRAADATEQRSKAANAYFHAGTAYLRAANDSLNRRDRDGAARMLTAATSALEKSISNSRSEPRIYEARLALARAYRLLGGFQPYRYEDASRVIDEALQSRPGKPNVAAQFESALLIRDRDGEAGKQTALRRLEVFSRADLDASEDPTLLAAGRAELLRLAGEIGNAALAERPVTRESTLRAINTFSLATSVAELPRSSIPAQAVAQSYIHVGQANLLLARLSAAGGTGAAPPSSSTSSLADCTVTSGANDWLDAALKAFRSALGRDPNSPEANFGAACALQARNRLPEAIPLFREAARMAPNQSSYLLALARAFGPARAAEAAPIYQQALALEQNNPSARAGIHVEIADIQERGGEVEAALRSLNAAVLADPEYKEAYLRRGRILFEQRGNYLSAVQDFRLAERLNRSPTDRAEALYYLSQIEVRKELDARARRAPSAGDAAFAINKADEAATINEDDSRDAKYRGQACLARVFFGRVNGADDSRFCIADERRDASALMYEGMFHLRQTFNKRGGDQARAWEAALSAFSDGLARIGEARSEETMDQRRLRSRLQVGRGVSLYCVGLESIGRQTINGAAQRADAEQFFLDYGIKLCASRG
jgi:tetratricopeptide (TPR) repeat protein